MIHEENYILFHFQKKLTMIVQQSQYCTAHCILMTDLLYISMTNPVKIVLKKNMKKHVCSHPLWFDMINWVKPKMSELYKNIHIIPKNAPPPMSNNSTPPHHVPVICTDTN